ncbi:TetR/AcrR family transcriptional regulator [Marisediminicola sp. LYQ134]|uniref:TetR/AcrR family transcriptional regulator n=1 Tax=Marisediminicola sp. LYQ134 TaxID=3391061 RepID=UPI003982EE29
MSVLQGEGMPERRIRADAAENRTRILAVAREQLDSTQDLRLNAVAKAAGLGQGTLYRHFPTREALLVEVYRADVAELVEAAGSLLAEHDAVTAMRHWLDRVADYARVKRGVLAVLEPVSGTELATSHTPRIGEAIALLLEAGRKEGTIRDDVDEADVLVLLGFLSRMTNAEAAPRASHLLGVLLDGLRARD